MYKGTINKEKAAALFAENAVLFERRDCVPENVAAGLFGSLAVEFAKRFESKDFITANGFGIGDYTAMYLTEYGFNVAATYHNVEYLQDLEQQQSFNAGKRTRHIKVATRLQIG